MSSERQIEANRLNAQKSTGPRTNAGKAQSSKNSYKHGACVSDAAVFDDPGSREVIETLTREYFDFYRPASPMQRDCLSEIVLCKVRLDRVVRIESGVLSDARDKAHGDHTFLEDGKRCHRFDHEHWPPDAQRVCDNVHLAVAWQDSEETIRRLSTYEARLYTRYRRALDRWEVLKSEQPPADLPPAEPPQAQPEISPDSAANLPPAEPPSDHAADPDSALARAHSQPPSTPSAPLAKNEPDFDLTPIIASPEDAR